MRSVLKIEFRYDNFNYKFKNLFGVLSAIGGESFGNYVLGGKVAYKYWCAEITGFDSKFKYARKFLRYKKDYSEANSKGSRYVYGIFMLEEGKYYEAKGWNYRSFFTCKNWKTVEVDQSEVDEWLKNIST